MVFLPVGKITDKKHLVFLNPSSGGGRAGRAIEWFTSECRKKNLDVTIMVSTSEDDLRQLIRKHAPAYSSVVAAGGDSTFTILLGELVGLGHYPKTGVVPLGSSDDYALSLGISSMEEAVSAISAGKTIGIDLPYIGLPGGTQKGPLWYFGGQASTGLSVDVNRFVGKVMKRFPFALAFQTITGVIGIIGSLMKPATRLTLQVEGDQRHRKTIFKGEFALALFSKIPFWATGKYFVPGVAPADGKIGVVLLEKLPFIPFFKTLFKGFSGSHIGEPGVTILYTRSVEIESETPVSVQIDGDIIRTPGGDEQKFQKFNIGVLPEKFQVYSLSEKGKWKI